MTIPCVTPVYTKDEPVPLGPVQDRCGHPVVTLTWDSTKLTWDSTEITWDRI